VKINETTNSAINNLGVDKATNVDKASAVKNDVKKEVSSSESKSADNVTLSPMAQQLKNIESNIGTDKVFDAQKVNEIKDAIARGQFKVNTEKVADGLIESVKTMLAK